MVIDASGNSGSGYDDFVAKLPENDCRFGGVEGEGEVGGRAEGRGAECRSTNLDSEVVLVRWWLRVRRQAPALECAPPLMGSLVTPRPFAAH